MRAALDAWYVSVVCIPPTAKPDYFIGYLGLYNSGFMQRDVSIGNCFRLKYPIILKPFSVKKYTKLLDAYSKPSYVSSRVEIRDRVTELKRLEEMSSVDEITEALQEVVHEANTLQTNVSEKLKVSEVCRAIISDGDLATYVPTYFITDHSRGEMSVSTVFYNTRAMKTDRKLRCRVLTSSCP